MSTPSQCAALLKHYLNEEIQKAKGLSNAKKWEIHPHSKFYSQEGTFRKVLFKKQVTNDVIPATIDKKVKKLPCIWHAAEQLKIRNAKGQIISCRKLSCEWPHRPLSQCSREELIAKADTLGALRAQYIKNVDAIKQESKNDSRDSKDSKQSK